MYFEIVGTITDTEVIARGTSIRELKGLKEQFGGKNWKKMKGSRPYVWPTRRNTEPKYTGTRRTVSDAARMKIKQLLD